MIYCEGHKKEHADKSWKYINGGWYCTEFHSPSRLSEFLPSNVADDRVEYFNSTLQPFRGGEVSKEYLEVHGRDAINVTDKEVKNAKYLWKDLKGYNTRDKSK